MTPEAAAPSTGDELEQLASSLGTVTVNGNIDTTTTEPQVNGHNKIVAFETKPDLQLQNQREYPPTYDTYIHTSYIHSNCSISWLFYCRHNSCAYSSCFSFSTLSHEVTMHTTTDCCAFVARERSATLHSTSSRFYRHQKHERPGYSTPLLDVCVLPFHIFWTAIYTFRHEWSSRTNRGWSLCPRGEAAIQLEDFAVNQECCSTFFFFFGLRDTVLPNKQQVEKSPNDKRAYRATMLPNGMKV